MANSGIIRRVDELGRIVIPKEIRKNFRLYEGSTLSISVNKNNEIVLTKYSKINNLCEYADIMVGILYENINCGILICDMESVISSSKKLLCNKKLNQNIIAYFTNRKNYIFQKKESMMPSIFDGDETIYTSQCIVPIVSEGDVIGGIIAYSTSEKTLDIEDVKICSIVAKILGDI
jgi:AbrB family transcriptional regulator (stage V sporulation protein T)